MPPGKLSRAHSQAARAAVVPAGKPVGSPFVDRSIGSADLRHPLLDYGTCKLLLDARHTTFVEGGDVTTANRSNILTHLPDQSLYGNHLDTPSISGKQGILPKFGSVLGGNTAYRIADGFIGQGAMMSNYPTGNFNVPIVGPSTVVCVCALHNLQVADVFDYQGFGARLRLYSASVGASWNFGDAVNEIVGSPVSGADVPQIIVGQANGANSFIRVNGVQVNGNAGSGGLGGIRIGSVYSSGADMNGLIGLLAFYEGVLDMPAIVDLEHLLNADWHLNVSL